MSVSDLSDLPDDLARLLALWQSKCAGRSMPARRDFTVEEFAPWLGRLHLVRVEGDAAGIEQSDGRYIVFATASVERYGREMTGKSLSQYEPPEMARRALDDHLALLRARRPIINRVNDSFGPVLMHWTRLALPLSDDGQRIDRYLVGLLYHL